LNLVLNAADACEREANSPRRVTVRVQEEGDNVVLMVDDTGPGVSDINAMFRPLYSTQERGKLAGLGLKICRDVVTAHGGHIEVVNLPELGSSFRVYLPRVADSSGVHPVSVPRAATSTARLANMTPRKVLVVDDDPVFSRTVRRALKPHDVRTAQTASEGEIALLDPSYMPDLVLCDVCLPGKNGHELHSRLAASRPEIAQRFVFVTGGALTKTEADYVKHSGCRTLAKPLDLKDILESLENPKLASMQPTSVRTLICEAEVTEGRTASR
jgi:ActR/RegA family two-component response regulator